MSKANAAALKRINKELAEISEFLNGARDSSGIDSSGRTLGWSWKGEHESESVWNWGLGD